jgi:hypothetical protein
MRSVRLSLQTAIISLNSVNRLIYVMVKYGVFFAVRTEFLNITYLCTSRGFTLFMVRALLGCDILISATYYEDGGDTFLRKVSNDLLKDKQI